jgi:hypothetical protein
MEGCDARTNRRSMGQLSLSKSGTAHHPWLRGTPLVRLGPFGKVMFPCKMQVSLCLVVMCEDISVVICEGISAGRAQAAAREAAHQAVQERLSAQAAGEAFGLSEDWGRGKTHS